MPLRSVVVAFDGSPPAEVALAEATELAGRSGASLSLVCVVPVVAGRYGTEMPSGDTVVETIEAARRMLADTKGRLTRQGVANVETTLLEGDPVDRIVEYVAQHGPSLVVVGSRGLSDAGRFFLGSVSDGILHHVDCSVLVVKSPRAASPRRRSRAV